MDQMLVLELILPVIVTNWVNAYQVDLSALTKPSALGVDYMKNTMYGVLNII